MAQRPKRSDYNGPTVPAPPYFDFVDLCRARVTEEVRVEMEVNGHDQVESQAKLVNTRLAELWKAYPREKKAGMQKAGQLAMDKYNEKNAEWKTTDDYRRYVVAKAAYRTERGRTEGDDFSPSSSSEGAKTPLSPVLPRTASPGTRSVGFVVLQFANIGFKFCVIQCPFYILRKIPRSHGLLSFLFMFYFLQMLGYIWLLIVAVIGTCSVQFTRCLEDWTTFCMEPTVGSSTLSMISSPVTLYIYYCLMRVLFFGSQAVYNFGWESFYEFPTIRKLLVESLTARYSSSSGAMVSEVQQPPNKSGKNSGKNTAHQGQSAYSSERHLQAQRTTLIFPLLFLTLSNIVLFVICLVDSSHEALAPHGRVQRVSRFVLLCAFFQWLSQYAMLFPNWHEAIWMSSRKMIYVIYATTVIICCRTAVWAVSPKSYWHSDSIGLALIDIFNNPMSSCIALTACMLSVLYGVFCIVGNKNLLRVAGYHPRVFEDEVVWRDRVIMFKYGLVFGGIAQFVRGVISPHIGILDAHNDYIVYSFLFPGLLTLIWCVTFTLSRIRFSTMRWLFLWILLSMLVAHALCTLAPAAKGHIVLKIIVTIHLVRQLLKHTCFLNTRPRDGVRGPLQRHVGVSELFIFPLVALPVTLCMTLVTLSVISRYQEANQYFFPTIGFNSTVDGDVHVDHLISKLYLSNDEEEEPLVPRYALCSTTKDLYPLDYALLSVVSYYDVDVVEKVMEGFFPSEKLPWEMRNYGHENIVWYEFFFPTVNQTVITVRGTDAIKLADYVEDIRMWTEPTSITVLSLFVPSVRMWTKSATEMVIHGVHEVMQLVGFRQDEWNYKSLLDYLQSIPKDQKVVLTGHSMGGGMASIVGMLAGRMVFAVQPPGTYHSIAKHQKMYKRDSHYRWLHHEQSTVIVEGDWVNNAFDDHGGLVQRVGCEHPEMAFMGGCHMIEGTVCHLLKHCGDPRKRWTSCRVSFQSPISFGAEVAWNLITQTDWAESMYRTFQVDSASIDMEPWNRTNAVVFAAILLLLSVIYYGL